VLAGRAVTPLLELRELRKTYRLRTTLLDRIRRRRPEIAAVAGVSLTVRPREILGVVGESGSGKSTLGKMIVRLLRPSSGAVIFRGVDVTGQEGRALLPYRRRVQMIFQNTHSSLNPRKRVGRMLDEAVVAAGARVGGRRAEADRLLGVVGLDPSIAARYPHELSGGQRQRVGIARALCMRPELLVADEPVSALDVSLQGQIINLLVRLRDELGVAMVFISHDLAVVGRICDRVAVMYAGRLVEIAPPDVLIAAPAHPYTRALVDAVPKGLSGREPRRAVVPPAPLQAGAACGCSFSARCPHAFALCAEREPVLASLSGEHQAACHLHSQGETV
jgi:oligopeptide/dipeptide ABC transporter ATP-binding protein